MKNFKITLFLLSLVCFFGCVQKSRLDSQTELKNHVSKNIKETLDSLNLGFTEILVVCDQNQDSIDIKLQLKNPYYEAENNKILLLYILASTDSIIQMNFNKVNFYFQYKDIKGLNKFTVQKKDIIETKKDKDMNPLFFLAIKLSILNLKEIEFLKYTLLIAEINKVMNIQNPDFSGSYWVFLNNYTKNCNSKDDKYRRYLKLLITGAEYPQNPANSAFLYQIQNLCN